MRRHSRDFAMTPAAPLWRRERDCQPSSIPVVAVAVAPAETEAEAWPAVAVARLIVIVAPLVAICRPIVIAVGVSRRMIASSILIADHANVLHLRVARGRGWDARHRECGGRARNERGQDRRGA